MAFFRVPTRDPMTRTTVHYTGRVQGVGFRYTAVQIAERFHVAGYVQNLPDGRVKLVAEGERTEVERFLDAVRDRLSRQIAAHSADPGAATGEFGDPTGEHTFMVRY